MLVSILFSALEIYIILVLFDETKRNNKNELELYVYLIRRHLFEKYYIWEG